MGGGVNDGFFKHNIISNIVIFEHRWLNNFLRGLGLEFISEPDNTSGVVGERAVSTKEGSMDKGGDE